MVNNQKVRDVMMPNFTKVEGVLKISDALNTMRGKKINAILVEPRDKNDVYGIMTLKDIARKVIGQNRMLHETHVYEIMSKPVIWVEPDMDIRYCARLFDNFGLAVAPVIEQGKILGIVSYHEIVLNGLVDLD